MTAAWNARRKPSHGPHAIEKEVRETVSRLRSLPPSVLKIGFDIAIANSLTYVRDAKMLYKHRSQSHARGLTIMALEEFAKAIMYHRARLGLNPVTYAEASLLKGSKRTRRGLEFDHNFKQRLGLVILADYFFNMQIVTLPPGDRRIKELVRRYVKVSSKYITTFAAEEQRQGCFYTAYENRKWHNPLKVKFTEISDIIPSLEEIIDLYKKLARAPLHQLRTIALGSMADSINHYSKLREAGDVGHLHYGYMIEQFRQLLGAHASWMALGVDVIDQKLKDLHLPKTKRNRLENLRKAFLCLLNGRTSVDYFRGRQITQEEYNEAMKFLSTVLTNT